MREDIRKRIEFYNNRKKAIDMFIEEDQRELEKIKRSIEKYNKEKVEADEKIKKLEAIEKKFSFSDFCYKDLTFEFEDFAGMVPNYVCRLDGNRRNIIIFCDLHEEEATYTYRVYFSGRHFKTLVNDKGTTRVKEPSNTMIDVIRFSTLEEATEAAVKYMKRIRTW